MSALEENIIELGVNVSKLIDDRDRLILGKTENIKEDIIRHFFELDISLKELFHDIQEIKEYINIDISDIEDMILEIQDIDKNADNIDNIKNIYHNIINSFDNMN